MEWTYWPWPGVWLLRSEAEIQHLVCPVPLQQEVCAYAGIANTV